jgi:signal peptidase I
MVGGNAMSNKPRRPWIAALLSLFVTGLGHLYSGNPKRGCIVFGIGEFLVLVFAVAFDVIVPNVFFILFAIAVGIVFVAFCVSDAVLIAKRKKEKYELAKYNRWYVYVGYIIAIGLFNYVYAHAVIIPIFIQAYKLPTGSMEPTLLTGDHLIVNKLIYRTAMPKRGDVIVFKFPQNPDAEYLKRLIGEPGDEVEVIGRTVFINGTPLNENYVRFVNPQSINDHFGPFRVPPENYFVMGDNRDNSFDSRFWGFVPRKNLIGKPLFIYWSYRPMLDEYREITMSGILTQGASSFINLFTKTRWNRTFHIIK